MSTKPKQKVVSLLKDQQDTVRVSTDYDRFVPHGLQRIIHAGHVNKIMASMKDYGFLASHPIGVVRDNEKFRIVDGHHRHAAAKSLRIPLRFVILEKEFESAVGAANTGKAWTCAEWARKHTLEGKPHFLTLNRYVVAGIPVLQAASMLAGITGHEGGSGNVARTLISGEFVVKDTSQIDCLVGFINEFKNLCPAIKTRSFIAAFSMCYQTPEFDVAQLRARISSNPAMLIKTASTQQMLDLLEDIYNHGSRIKIPLAFKAREASSGRRATARSKDKEPHRNAA